MNRIPRMPTPGWLGLIVFLIGFPVLAAGAEGQRIERQVEVLPDRGIVEITAELRGLLELFPDFPGFRRARLFVGEPGPMVLEIEGVREGRTVRERRELDAEGLRDLRSVVESRLAALDTRAVITQEGRGRLVLEQTGLGLGYHGWALPVALDLESSRSNVAAYLLTAGSHFYLPYRLTRDRTVSDSHRLLTTHGGTRGILSGILLGDAVAGRESDDRSRVRLIGGMALGTAGSVAGFMAVDRWRPAEGSTHLWAAMGDAGLAAGAAAAYVAGPYADQTVEVVEGDVTYTETRTRNTSLGHAITLAGQGAGLAAGAWLGARRTHTPGNVLAFRSASILGAQSGVTVARTAGIEEGRGLAAAALAGGLGGMWAGDHLLRPEALTGGEGLLINAGHLAGGALALGATYLVVDELDDREVLYLATSTAGSLLGAGLVWRAVVAGGGPSGREARGPMGDWSVVVNPAALFTGALVPGPPGPVRRIPPVLSVRF